MNVNGCGVWRRVGKGVGSKRGLVGFGLGEGGSVLKTFCFD